MALTDVFILMAVSFGLGMLFTMVAECLSGGRFIEIFFPKNPPEIIMTVCNVDTEEDDEEN